MASCGAAGIGVGVAGGQLTGRSRGDMTGRSRGDMTGRSRGDMTGRSFGGDIEIIERVVGEMPEDEESGSAEKNNK